MEDEAAIVYLAMRHNNNNERITKHSNKRYIKREEEKIFSRERREIEGEKDK